MTKNVVDMVIEVANENNKPFGIIPSRRQVDHDSGYTGWITPTLTEYIKNKTNNVICCRDHGGPNQGEEHDDGLLSFEEDCLSMDLIHIDPWKISQDLNQGIKNTISLIKYCYNINPSLCYEVGTEEAIFSYSSEQLYELLYSLKVELPRKAFNNIKYAVIQSGTSLEACHNTGRYDNARLKDMVEVCKEISVLSKEHNGDFLSLDLIKDKFSSGLDAINIAPEFGQIETNVIIDIIKNDKELYDDLFEECLDSNKWRKWVSLDFNPPANKDELIRITGHYLNDFPIIKTIKDKYSDIDHMSRIAIKKRLLQLLEVV